MASNITRHIIRCLLPFAVLATVLSSCNPEAKWTTKDVVLEMDVLNVSAGFAECWFSTAKKDAYYLVGATPVDPHINPMRDQKQFMTLAVDSAYAAYLNWRNRLLKEGEFNIAPFASHSLQYGDVHYFFTGLTPSTDYWIYAFVVNPETLTPAGGLYLESVHTLAESQMVVRFDYRIKGYWDYIYPLTEYGDICDYFPYVGTTRDSLDIATAGQDPQTYFSNWLQDLFDHPDKADVLYGVKAIENDGWDGHILFETGHTYYTAIAGFDGPISQHNVIYKFTWQGDSTEYYFTEKDALE